MITGKDIIDFLKILPRWLMIFTVLSVLAYFSALTIVAVTTERDVTLFPPKIGPGPKHLLAKEIQELRNAVKELSDAHYKQVTYLREQLAMNREKAAANYGGYSIGQAYEYRKNADEFQTEIQELEKSHGERIAELQNRLEILQQQLENAALISPSDKK